MKKSLYYIFIVSFFSLTSITSKAQTCNLVCSDQVNASLRADSCKRSFDPRDFLKGADAACSTYSVTLKYPFGTNTLDGKTVDASHVGYTMVYEVKNGTNSCWGYVTIEDKANPLPLCKSATISCFQFGKINELANRIIDNCTQEGKSIIESLKWEDYGCSIPDITGRVIRSIRTFDAWNNSGTCTDTLLIRKDSFSLVKAPDMINLSCLMSCKKPNNSGSATQPSNFDQISFSKDKNNIQYPSPEKLIDLQSRDTFGSTLQKCIPSNLRVVPYIKDSVFRWVGNQCFRDDTCISMFPNTGLLCKLLITYSDEIFTLCGAGFKIRREWRLTNWCTKRDSFIIQYINVEDKQAPVVKEIDEEVTFFTLPHDCYVLADLPRLEATDCSIHKQTYILKATHPATGKVTVLSGDLPANQIKLEHFGTNPANNIKVEVSTIDACYYQTISHYYIRTLDNIPPTPTCDEFVQATVDPATCWARIYAKDLDNGSHDNCCNVLHFAVAKMADIDSTRKTWESHWGKNCNADWWKYKYDYDLLLEDVINFQVFKDYIDLTECGTNQVVLRVYEACGVPAYDPHVFPCSEHLWFCYNNFSSVYRVWHNYTFFHSDGEYIKSGKNIEKACAAIFGPFCFGKELFNWFDILEKDYGSSKFKNPYAEFVSSDLKVLNDTYYGSFYYGGAAPSFNCSFITTPASKNTSKPTYPPGNICSSLNYADCMLTISVDDKTSPVTDEPNDKFWYCDNVSTEGGDIYEYASCNDESYDVDNGRDKRCRDANDIPYNYIESVKENDPDMTDTINGVNKYYGWYGCNVYLQVHDEHGDEISCDLKNTWSPVYCRSWLILDKNDAAGKINPKLAFDSPILKNGQPGTSAPSGKFYIWDNCWIDEKIDSTDEQYFDNCGNGWIKRTWKAKDKCGNSVSVDQKIVTKHRSDFEAIFPADKLSVCGNKEDISPDALGRPMIMDDECELIGVNYEDQKFDIVPDACYKIIRTWKIIDWCKYNPNQIKRDQEVIVDDRTVADKEKRPCVYRHIKDNGDGYIEYLQVIVIKDTIRPEIDLKDTTICFYDNSCFLQSIHIPFTATDNCTKNEFLSFRYEMDENPSASDLSLKSYNKGSIDKSNANIKSLTTTQKVGTALVHVIAEDNCGNEDTTSFVLTVKDCKKPTPYCYHGIATVIMPSTGEIKVWAKDLNAGSYDNCTPNNKLTFSFNKDLKDSCKVFDCKTIPNGVSFTVQVEIYVTDEAGNTDVCRTFVDIQDNDGNVCDNAKSIAGSISGTVKTKNEVQIENTILEATSSIGFPAFKTNSSGQYAFTNIPLKSPISVTANRNDNPTNGVTTIDVLKIQRHILGLEPFTDGYSFVAADVNNDKEITSVDMIELRKIILNITESFPNNNSWRFVPKSHPFNLLAPFNFPEKIDISSLEQDELKRDFVGIKIGDLNHTAQAHSLLGTESRSSGKYVYFNITDKSIVKGQQVEIEITSKDITTMQSMQFTCNHKGLELVSITPGTISFTENNIALFSESFTASWNDINTPLNLQNKRLFILVFKAKESMSLSESISINSKITPVEVFDGNEVFQLGLKWNDPIADHKFSLYQNIPNPFTDQTNITYTLPFAEHVEFSVTDLTGQVVYKQKISGKKGYNQILLNRKSFSASGIYYYTIESTHFKETKKMILVK